MKNAEELKKELEIDFLTLDIHLAENAKSCLSWGMELAEAIFKRDSLERALKLKYSELDQQIRISAEKKPTEDAIKSSICVDSEYSEIYEQMLQADKEVNVLKAVKDAFDKRTSALNGLIDLYRQGYWQKPEADMSEITKGYKERKGIK